MPRSRSTAPTGGDPAVRRHRAQLDDPETGGARARGVPGETAPARRRSGESASAATASIGLRARASPRRPATVEHAVGQPNARVTIAPAFDRDSESPPCGDPRPKAAASRPLCEPGRDTGLAGRRGVGVDVALVRQHEPTRRDPFEARRLEQRHHLARAPGDCETAGGDRTPPDRRRSGNAMCSRNGQRGSTWRRWSR